MKFIPTKIHGYLDYTIGLLLIAAPWLFNFHRGGAETWTPVVLGAAAIIYSLFTRYELGAMKVIPMRTHLMLDYISGALLAVSPWLFGFAHFVAAPHGVMGLLEIGIAFVTLMRPVYGEDRAHAHAV